MNVKGDCGQGTLGLKKAFVSFGPQKKLAFPAIEGGKVEREVSCLKLAKISI
jgi:hypothetical protein